MNQYYTYKNIDVWNMDPEKQKKSPVQVLNTWMADRGILDTPVIHEKPPREDGIFTAKNNSLVWPETAACWASRGMIFSNGEAGGANWIALVPEDVSRHQHHEEPEVLVIEEVMDYANPMWVMDSMEIHAALNEMAAENHILLLYIVSRERQFAAGNMNYVCEFADLNHLNLSRMYLDVSGLTQKGFRLTDVSGLQWKNDEKKEIEWFGPLNTPVLDISDQWQDSGSFVMDMYSKRPPFGKYLNRDALIHSMTGRLASGAAKLELDYEDPEDPGLLSMFQRMGLDTGIHPFKDTQWVTVSPISALRNETEKMPLMIIMMEVQPFHRHNILSAYAAFFEYIKLAAQGEMTLLFFARETAADNDALTDVITEAENLYPIDPGRIYLTGHSHNACLLMEFMRRHWKMLAGVAQLGNCHGIPAPDYSNEPLKVTDEMIACMSTFDMPTIHICGQYENAYVFDDPVPPFIKKGFESKAFQRRLKASRCPERSEEEISAAVKSGTFIEKHVGVPGDREDAISLFGTECYWTDEKNIDGKYHLRLTTLWGMRHAPVPQMPYLSWNFLRRFARSTETGKIIELF